MKRPRRLLIRMTYSEILRAVGGFADKKNLRVVRIVETEDGMILQGEVSQGPLVGHHDTFQLSATDIENMLRDAHIQRVRKIR